MKRRFMVKVNFPTMNVKYGDIGEFVSNTGDYGLLLIKGPTSWIPKAGFFSPYIYFDRSIVQEIEPLFEKNDIVRVKKECEYTTFMGAPSGNKQSDKDRKIKIRFVSENGKQCDVVTTDSGPVINSLDTYCLELWNDNEEWDSKKLSWVPRKNKKIYIAIDGEIKLNSCTFCCESIDAAEKEAKRLSKLNPNKKFTIVQVEEIKKKSLAEQYAEKFNSNKNSVIKTFINDKNHTWDMQRINCEHKGDHVIATYKILDSSIKE